MSLFAPLLTNGYSGIVTSLTLGVSLVEGGETVLAITSAQVDQLIENRTITPKQIDILIEADQLSADQVEALILTGQISSDQVQTILNKHKVGLSGGFVPFIPENAVEWK